MNKSERHVDFARRLVDGDDRWTLIDDFVRWWYGPEFKIEGNTDAEIDAAEERIGVKLPQSLRRWYRYAGKSISSVSNNQNHLLRLNELQPLEETYGRLHVQIENQAVYQWAIRADDLAQEDPPVHMFMDSEYIGPFRPSTSQWLLCDLIYEAFAGGHSVERRAERSDLDGCARLPWEPGIEDDYAPEFYITEDSLIEFSEPYSIVRIAERRT